MRSFVFVPVDSERKPADGPALTLGGRTLERPHLVLARRLLERVR